MARRKVVIANLKRRLLRGAKRKLRRVGKYGLQPIAEKVLGHDGKWHWPEKKTPWERMRRSTRPQAQPQQEKPA